MSEIDAFSSPLSSLSSLVPNPSDVFPLSSLEPGTCASVARILPHVFAQRLRDLGFSKGSLVSIRLRAPLGDPTEYEIRGTRICLRRSEAAMILVSPCSPKAPEPPTPSTGEKL